MAATPLRLLAEARGALQRGDWATARSLLNDALGVSDSGPNDDDAAPENGLLDRTDAAPSPVRLDPAELAEAWYLLARSVEWAGDYEAAVHLYERAFAAYRRLGETRIPALIAGRELSFLHGAVYGNEAVAAGWLERAKRLAAAAGDCIERGWVELAVALATDDPDLKEAHVDSAAAIADRLGDPDLQFCALGYQGTSLVLRGDITAGMRRVDEAAAAAAGGEVRTTSRSARSSARCCSAAS